MSTEPTSGWKAVGVAALFVLGCELVGIAGALTTETGDSSWYAGLDKPPFNPPGWLFGPVWTVLYALMGIAAFRVWRAGTERAEVRRALGLFAAQLVLNGIWTPIFFGAESIVGGAVVIVLLLATLAPDGAGVLSHRPDGGVAARPVPAVGGLRHAPHALALGAERMSLPLRILGFAGSLRAGSYNRALLAAARELMPEGVAFDVFDLAPLPLYNTDLDTYAARPEAVVQFKAAITDADALLIATPEYNHNIPGVLQNAIDWASRPAFNSPLAGKPVGIMGAATGSVGTARAQEVLKVVLLAVLAHVFPHRGVLVGGAAAKFETVASRTKPRAPSSRTTSPDSRRLPGGPLKTRWGRGGWIKGLRPKGKGERQVGTIPFEAGSHGSLLGSSRF